MYMQDYMTLYVFLKKNYGHTVSYHQNSELLQPLEHF